MINISHASEVTNSRVRRIMKSYLSYITSFKNIESRLDFTACFFFNQTWIYPDFIEKVNGMMKFIFASIAVCSRVIIQTCDSSYHYRIFIGYSIMGPCFRSVTWEVLFFLNTWKFLYPNHVWREFSRLFSFNWILPFLMVQTQLMCFWRARYWRMSLYLETYEPWFSGEMASGVSWSRNMWQFSMRPS